MGPSVATALENKTCGKPLEECEGIPRESRVGCPGVVSLVGGTMEMVTSEGDTYVDEKVVREICPLVRKKTSDKVKRLGGVTVTVLSPAAPAEVTTE